jgi:osmotically-inducible protein OsmY
MLPTGGVLARDPSTPPALGDTPDGAERSPGSQPERAQDRYESETRPKSDEMLATAVHENLTKDSRVNAMNVRVGARQGVVELTGMVPREADREAAESIARQVAGVRDVKNAITVEAGPTAVPGTPAIPEKLGP